MVRPERPARATGRQGPTRPEEGFALVMSVVLIAIMMALGAVVVANGVHSDHSSARGRNWETAIHVAEAGVQQAIARMAEQGSTNLAPFAGETAEGSYRVVVSRLARNRVQIDSVGRVGRGERLATSRAVRVTLGPPRSFRYALFSMNDIETKNNDHVTGDVWANGSVRVDQNDVVDGAVVAATGWVSLDANSEVTGDVTTGGIDPDSGRSVEVGTGASIGGRVRAASTVPGCADDPGRIRYGVHVVGAVGGSVRAWGAKTGGGPTGSFTTGVCERAPATKAIPPFTYNPADYSPAPMEFTSPAAFNAWLDAGNRHALSGTYFVSGSGVAIDLDGVTVGGDTTVIATGAPISVDGGSGIGAATPQEQTLVLVSYYQPPAGSVCATTGGNPDDCAIGIRNNFQPGDRTATLLYAPNGPVAFKNNAEFHGSVYAADIQLKNNMELVYEERLEQLVGFGPVALEPERWVEL